MKSFSDLHLPNDQRYSGLGSAEEIESAIELIFEAFEVTPLHEDAVMRAKKRAAQKFSGEQRDRAVVIIDQLGRMMDLRYWESKGRRKRHFLS
ncbi:hypothetical protein BH11PSE11_BH11PSE11_24000 [soil metagenome]